MRVGAEKAETDRRVRMLESGYECNMEVVSEVRRVRELKAIKNEWTCVPACDAPGANDAANCALI